MGRETLARLLAESEMTFTPPLRFEFAQGSDQTGEYHTSVARFVDARGETIIDLVAPDGWVDVQMHAIAEALNLAALSRSEAPEGERGS